MATVPGATTDPRHRERVAFAVASTVLAALLAGHAGGVTRPDTTAPGSSPLDGAPAPPRPSPTPGPAPGLPETEGGSR